MKPISFVFYCSNVVPFHSKSLEERPLGGTETGVIRLAECLQKMGHQVSVYTPHENPPDSNPKYFFKDKLSEHRPFDVFISTRDWIPLLFQVPAKVRLLWTGDSYDQFPNFGLGDLRVSKMIDGLLTVSDWQAKALCSASGFPLEKSMVIRNGIHLPYFEGSEDRKRKRLIYSSTPYRGLEHTPKFLRALKAKFSDLEFHVFSGYKVYDQNESSFEELRSSLKSVDGITIHGNILQKDLAREFMKSSILFYPSHFEETSCITAMEAMASGCVPLTTRLGALPETIGNAGILIEGLPHEDSYSKAFLSACERLLTDDDYFDEFSKRGLKRSKELTWDLVANRLIQYLNRFSL